MEIIGICGAGLIGASWAIGFANAGYRCLVYDTKDSSFENFDTVSNQLFQDLKILNPDLNIEKIKSNIVLKCSIEEICKNSILIQESIIENLDAKKKVFQELDKLSSKNTIIASSSSYLLISKISEDVEHKDRCINAHPALPPHVVPFVEVGGSVDTSTDIIKKAISIYKNANYAAIVINKETEGFVLNRLQGALLNEAVRLHEGGFASMDDIDTALKHALGIRWAFMGPFEIMDLNAPEGIKDSFTRYKSGIQNLAKEQNSVPEYSEEYLNKLENEQRKRLAYSDRSQRIEKRNKMIALIRKLKLELGEDIQNG
ncbi:3-hydroxyacyl-CoA dehydrogenase NAD-binding domain-containing protein [Alphaproteobacteria bacterium]|nr:3-hydroxyacyl-CoA dehydrogenase NAD-binding domain-containing protein [Alphaproteobacteria bacterium]